MREVPIPGCPGYLVTDDGHVISLKAGGRRNERRQLRGLADKDGYVRMLLSLGPRGRRKIIVHQVVADVFVAPRPPGAQVRHLDGNPANNDYRNLAWGTYAENAQDKIRHGRSTRGATNPNVKITAATVTEIRARYISGQSQERIAREVGLGQSQISRIVRRVCWPDVV